MAFASLPGVFENKLDGNLTIVPTSGAPIVAVIGTALQGDSEELFRVNSVSEASRTFGKTGTLVRGLYEARLGGATNLRLFRIGATAAVLTGVGSGITIETVAKDASAGTDVEIFWDDAAGRLQVWRVSDGELVYDNNPTYPLESVDLGVVVVSGDFTAGGNGDLGTLSVPVTLEAADGTLGAAYTAGTDGAGEAGTQNSLSRMKLYEALYDAYQLLEDQEIDVVLPMNIHVDDLNVMDLNGTNIQALGLDSLSDYPVAGSTTDALGKLFVEEYEGKNYFWWWFPDTHSSPTFSAANIAPSAGSASTTTKTDGTALTADDFHEVNFGWQLAYFNYLQSRDNTEMNGAIGMLPPSGFSPKAISQWVGSVPTTSDATGDVLVTANGSGLLGNKFMAGRAQTGSGLSLIPAFTINGKAGLFEGGFIATDDGWLDGTHLLDDNDSLVDIGKYISVVATPPVLSNPSRNTSYVASGAPTYGGFYSDLAPQSAPTHKLLDSIRLRFRLNKTKLDLLATQRYVTFHQGRRGIVVSDAPTAARSGSDYSRLSTVRQVKDCVDGIREVADEYLGEGMSGTMLAAFETAIDGELNTKVKDKVINRYEFQLISTPQQRILGQATVELKLVPAFELRQITVVIGLAAV